jgi:hypothetical protein
LQNLCRTKGETWDNADVSRRRRIIAAVCIAAIVFSVALPFAAAYFVAVLVPLPPLFGTVVSIDGPQPESLSVEPSPTPSPLPTRAPPA